MYQTLPNIKGNPILSRVSINMKGDLFKVRRRLQAVLRLTAIGLDM